MEVNVINIDDSGTRYFVQGNEQWSNMFELAFVIEIACICGKDISEDPTYCVTWPRFSVSTYSFGVEW